MGAEQRPPAPEAEQPRSEFYQTLENRWSKGLFVCVGLDSEFAKIPDFLKKGSVVQNIFNFNTRIIDATHDLALAYKPNSAFYEEMGVDGIQALILTADYAKRKYPEIPIILDAKRADIGNTNNGYAKFAFDIVGADAITVHPYLGKEALKPFLNRKDKGVIVLCRTSNPGAGEFQDLIVDDCSYGDTPLFGMVAANVFRDWNEHGNVGLVVGATYPEELEKVRKTVGDMPILIPGVGAQGGDLEKAVRNGKDSNNQGMIINSSRGIIFASGGEDFAAAARRETQKLTNEINTHRLA